jgi:DNA-binding Xre family transcriptional regulator
MGAGAMRRPSFATHVRLLVDEHGVREAARRIGGIHAATLSRLQRGYSPTLRVYLRICRYLEINPAMFMHEWNTPGRGVR